MKRIIALVLILLLVFPQVVGAAEINVQELVDTYLTDQVDMDRVYQYDYLEDGVEDSEQEEVVLQYANAAQVVMGLELMFANNDGTFPEQEYVPFSEFADIIMKLSAGGVVEEISQAYKEYPDSRFVTQHEAAHYLVGVLGYDIYDSRYNGENPRSVCADRIKLLKGIDFSGNKSITRGELAQMIFNALQTEVIEQTTFGSVNSYSEVKGKTLIKRCYNADFVFGMVTAQYGFDFYSTVGLKDNQIKINNAVFSTKNLKNVGDYLGHRMIAIAETAEDTGAPELLMLAIDASDETIVLSSEQLAGVSGNELCYEENGEEKEVDLGHLERIMLNGSAKSSSEIFGILNSAFEGEIRLCMSEYNGDIDSLIVFQYSTYEIERISPLNETITLADGRKYDNSTTISYGEDKKLYFKKDGKATDISSVMPKQIISIVENPSKTAMLLLLSSQTVKGQINGLSGDKVLIEKEWYSISDAYEAARQNNNKMPELTMYASGTFLLDVDGRIAGYSSSGGSQQYGFMTKIGSLTTGLNSQYLIRVFTMDNEWKNFELADKLTVDGVTGLDKAKAYEQLDKYKASICNAPIRYRATTDGKVTFLDTVRASQEEMGDGEQIKLGATQEVKVTWTRTYKRITFDYCKYSLEQTTGVFTIPEDLTKERQYFYGSPSLPADETIKLDFYNLDEFDVAGLAVTKASTGSVSSDGSVVAVVCGKYKYYDEESGEVCTGLELYNSSGKPHWNTMNVKVDEVLEESVAALKVDDVIRAAISGGKLSAFRKELDVENGEHLVDVTDNMTKEGSRTVGSVVAVDPDRGYVRIRCGEEEATYWPTSRAMYDTQKNKGYQIEFGDMKVGDRVFCSATLLFGAILIIR